MPGGSQVSPTTILLEARNGKTSFGNGELLTSLLFSDLTLSCPRDCKSGSGGRVELKAHRAIVASKSSVLCAILAKDDSKRSKAIELDDISAADMQSLLEFAYQGECSCLDTTSALSQLLVAANTYNIVELKPVCEDKLRKRLDVTNALDLALLADRQSAPTLRTAAVKFIKSNGGAIAKHLRTAPELSSHAQLIKEICPALVVANNNNATTNKPQSAKSNPFCYFDVSIGAVPAGRIVFKLRSDIVPKTAEVFRTLCVGRDCPGYEGSLLYSVVAGVAIYGGNINSGRGDDALIYDKVAIPQENFVLKHDAPGTLSMLKLEVGGKNSSGFFISLDKAPYLDGSQVVIGMVVAGMDVVERVESCGSRDGRTSSGIVIEKCGEL